MTRFATRAVHAGLEPDPTLRRRRPGDPPVDDLRAARAGRVRRAATTTRARPTRRATRSSARSASSRAGSGSAFSSGMAAEHALITAVCEAGDARRHPRRPLRRHLPARRQGALALGPGVHDGRPDRPRRGRARGARRHAAGVGRDADQPDAEGGRHPGDRRARAAARSWRSTTRSRRRSTSGRWSSARTPPCTRRRSTSAGTRTRSAARSIVRDEAAARGRALRAELDRRGARAARLLPRAPRAAHAAPADGGAHGERARHERVAGGRRRRLRHPLARVLGDGLVPASGRGRDRRRARSSSRSPSRSAASSR